MPVSAARATRNDADDGIVPSREKLGQSERAYIELKRLILDNELPAGSHLLEAEASERLSMSRTPTREAMLRLQTEGLVEIRPRHGMRVLPISSNDVREMYEVLTGLEAIAAHSVAKRGVSEVEMAGLRNAIADMDTALANDDLAFWAKADERFHSQLVSLSGNHRLISVVNQFVEQAHRARMLTLKLRPKPTQSNRDHEALVDALAQRDAERARKIHHEHRDRAKETIVEILQRLGF